MNLRRTLAVMCFVALGVADARAQGVPNLEGTWEATGVVSAQGYSKPAAETLVITQTDRELVLESRQKAGISRKKYRFGVRGAKVFVEADTIVIYETGSTNKSDDLYFRETRGLDQPRELGFQDVVPFGPPPRAFIVSPPPKLRAVHSVSPDGWTLEVEAQSGGKSFVRYFYRRVDPAGSGAATTR